MNRICLGTITDHWHARNHLSGFSLVVGVFRGMLFTSLVYITKTKSKLCLHIFIIRLSLLTGTIFFSTNVCIFSTAQSNKVRKQGIDILQLRSYISRAEEISTTNTVFLVIKIYITERIFFVPHEIYEYRLGVLIEIIQEL